MRLVALSGCCVGTGLSGVCGVTEVGMVWVFLVEEDVDYPEYFG